MSSQAVLTPTTGRPRAMSRTSSGPPSCSPCSGASSPSWSASSSPPSWPGRSSTSAANTSPSAACARCTPRPRSSPSAAPRCSARRSTSCSAPAARACSAARRSANFVFWGYQFFIVMAALSYVMGYQPEPGIRRTRVAYRPLADHRLGRLRGDLHRHADEARGAAHLRGELVLPRVHPDHRRAAHRQQPGDADLGLLSQELLASRRACRTR